MTRSRLRKNQASRLVVVAVDVEGGAGSSLEGVGTWVSLRMSLTGLPSHTFRWLGARRVITATI